MMLKEDVNMHVLPKKTPGFVGVDARSLMRETTVVAMNQIFKDVFEKKKKVNNVGGVVPMINSEDGSSDISKATEEEKESTVSPITKNKTNKDETKYDQ
eukprot:9633707-Ditylum_brightwellii.AAC.1